MRWLRFYVPAVLSEQADIEVDENTRHHMAQVLRLRVGAALILFNGDGYDYHGVVSALERKRLVVSLSRRELVARESHLDLSVYLCLLKNETMDRVVQKAVELGAKRIVPVRCERMEWRGDEAKKHQHWQSIIQSAAMQCGRARLPELTPVMDFQSALLAEQELRWIFTPHHAAQKSALAQVSSMAVWLGCEGGFSEAEVQSALAAGWYAQSLGTRILRADTAAVVAMAQAQAQYGDLG